MSPRPDIRLTEAEQQEWLQNGHTMILTTTGKDGYPHSVAMWYVLMDGAMCFSTYGRAQKTVNVRRNPKVACLLEDGRTYDTLRGLMIRGDAEVVEDPQFAGDVQLALFRKYTAEPGVEITPDLEAAVRASARKRVVIRVRPVKIASWDHAKQAG